ncbi:MAG: NAD(P)/FAD-dependent oxidoreductase [Formosimonas sp.]
MQNTQTEILIIGAGPSGSVAAGILRQNPQRQVMILERSVFPRFSIGESLLPQSMAYLEEAGMLQAVVEHGFQYKNGAAFAWGEQACAFDFRKKFSAGWGTTYQVDRASFDQILATQAAAKGADLRFQQEVTSITYNEATQTNTVSVIDHANGTQYTVEAKFVLDASGFARVLPRLLDLETPSGFPTRQAIFTHVDDHITDANFDRNKILITVHPEHVDVWFWLIPFSNGRCSLGVVATQEFLAQFEGELADKLNTLVKQTPSLSSVLKNATFPIPVQTITGYSANVKSLIGPGYALLGNAGEFLDPVFSSGITIAMRSASLAAACLAKQLDGQAVDWLNEYEHPLRLGVNTFRTYVEAWYDGDFQKVIFSQNQNETVRDMISSILAGYAWDINNPFVEKAKRRLNLVKDLCDA